MAKDNQNVKETKATLEEHLKNVGLKDDTAFKKARTAYNAMWSAKRVKADLNRWHDIGFFVQSAWDSMAEKGINQSTGHLSKLRETYFREMTGQDFSNARWLADHFPEVKLWIETNKRNLSNPASIKQAIRKKLVEDKADKADFVNFGMKPPKPSNSNPPDNSGNTQSVDTKVSHDERLKHLELITNQLVKAGPKKWTLENFKRFENALQTLETYYEDMADKLEKAGTVKVNSEVMKKKAA